MILPLLFPCFREAAGIDQLTVGRPSLLGYHYGQRGMFGLDGGGGYHHPGFGREFY